MTEAKKEEATVVSAPGNNDEVVMEKTASTSGEEAAEEREDADATKEEPEKSKLSVFLMMIALMSATFLVALDVNILATAIPKITTEFGSIDDVSWYGAAYSLCKMAFQPSYGRICTVFPLKMVFYVANVFLAIGSIICATAPSSMVLILGRAMQGLGGAGLFSTVITLVGFVVSKRKLPIFVSFLSSMYMVASIAGPVLGGAFAGSSLTWRFCFWINLPLQAIAVALTVFTIPEPKRESTNVPLKEKLISMDPLGTVIIICSITSLILALQWGGISLPWSDSRVWGCLLCFVLTLALFIGLQVYQGDKALIPMKVVTQRTVAFSCGAATLLLIGINVPTYFLPFYFQASLGVDTTTSGLYILPLAGINPFASMAVATVVTATGIYVPWMMASGAVAALGYGLLSTLNVNSNLGHIIGYQIIASIGFGLGVQLPFTAMRNVLSDADIPIGNALLVFSQGLGTSLSLSVGQTVFLNSLRSRLDSEFSGSEASRIADLGAGDIDSDHLSEDAIPLVEKAYAHGLRSALYLSVASAALACLCAAAVEWKKIEKTEKKKDDAEQGDTAAAVKADVKADVDTDEKSRGDTVEKS